MAKLRAHSAKSQLTVFATRGIVGTMIVVGVEYSPIDGSNHEYGRRQRHLDSRTMGSSCEASSDMDRG